jgi:hypothetical protein
MRKLLLLVVCFVACASIGDAAKFTVEQARDKARKLTGTGGQSLREAEMFPRRL